MDNLFERDITFTPKTIVSEARAEMLKKWSHLGFLEDLNGHVRENIATLYDSRVSSLVNDIVPVQPEGGDGFDTVTFPVVRRVFSQLLANDIVAVQPMESPIGKLFYFTPENDRSSCWVLFERPFKFDIYG